MQTCSCPLCSKGNYDPSEFIVDLSELRRERPVGVSGLMRVKNEARWVAQSIDSCIDVLDELIICYQTCSDETPDIIEQKRLQYPDKIKVFFYAPPVYAHNLSKEEFDYACNLPEDSIHLLSNYYNYTLSKATYRYAVKIDADQIYFSERLKIFCDAYCDRVVSRCTISTNFAYLFFKLFMILSSHYPRVFFRLWDFLPYHKKIIEKYLGYLCVQISQTKKPVSLSGINLYKGEQGWGIPTSLGKLGRVLSFNGVGDHLIFRISETSYYYPTYRTYEKEEARAKIIFEPFVNRHIIEYFHFDSVSFLWGGFC